MAANTTQSSVLGDRYATALFDLADRDKVLDPVADDMRALRAALAESEDLRRLTRSPVLSREQQGRAMAALLDQAGAHALTRKFVGLVAANRRLFALPAIISAFLDELARRRGEMTAVVTSAVLLTDAQIAKLTDQLKAAFGAKVTLEIYIDPAILGGLVVRVGSRMIDSSLRTKLAKLNLAMKGIA